MIDLDQGGSGWQRTKAFLGPTLGWSDAQVKPTRTIATPGTFAVFPGDSVILVNAAGLVTIQLPDVRLWVASPNYQPATGFERSIWIKDFGGNASTFPITIAPFSGQSIDMLAPTIQITVNRQIMRLYPLNELTGWWVG